MIQTIDRTDRYFFIGIIFILGVTALLYWPGIDGPFVLDDSANISRLGEFGGITNFDALRQFVFSNASGPGGRSVAMLSFLIDAQDWPVDPASFKYTNIMIHLLCGLAFCWLAFLLGQHLKLSKPASAQIALIVTGIWLLHPLNVSTTLYIVQRMAQLMTLFATLSLVFYLLGRRALESNLRRAMLYLLLCLFPFGLLSVLSKENGALLLLIIVVLERLFFANDYAPKAFKIWYRIGVVFPLLIVLAYLAYSTPDFLTEYSARNFTLGERLLTETRILSNYIWNIFLPSGQLGSVIHDNYPVSTSLLDPLSTFTSSVFLVLLLSSAIYLRRSQPVYSFAVLWFFTLHLVESTYIPLELYFEHRNYMAMFGPLYALIWYLRRLLVSQVHRSFRYFAQFAVLAVVALSIWLSWQFVAIWSDPMSLNSRMAMQKPDSYRAQSNYVNHLELQGYIEQAHEQLFINLGHHPNDVLSLLNVWNFSCKYGFEQPLSIAEIAAKDDLEMHAQGVHVQLNVLLQNIRDNRCQPPEIEALFSLYERVGEFNLRPGMRASYYSSYSDLFFLLQRVDEGLAKLDLSSELSSSIDYRIKQALIASLFGQLDRALGYLELAREADLNRPRLLPSRRASIEQVESQIMALRASATNQTQPLSPN